VKVRAFQARSAKLSDGTTISFEAGEVKELDPIDAAFVVVDGGWSWHSKEFPFRLEGEIDPIPGCLVTWMSERGIEGPATVLCVMDVNDDRWVLLLDVIRERGYVVRARDVLSCNPHNVLAAALLAILDDSNHERTWAARAILTHVLAQVREEGVEG